MSEKQKWPRAEAQALADELIAFLTPVCARIAIAGSLRRKKDNVGDIEILYIPIFSHRNVEVDLFTTRLEPYNETDANLTALIKKGYLLKRLSKTGSTAWGEKNKLGVHAATGIPVDFFATTDECWENYMVCRTGPAELNIEICKAAIAKGWAWSPYGAGFTRIGHTEVMRSEREVFEFVGMTYREPHER